MEEFKLGSSQWGDNLVSNPGFEVWDSDEVERSWIKTVTGASTIKKSSIAKFGDHSAEAYVASGAIATLQQPMSYTKGILYKLIVWIRCTDLLPVQIQTFINVPTGSLNRQFTVSKINTWEKFEEIFRSNGNDDVVWIRNNSSNYTWYADGIQLLEFEPIEVELT